MSHEDELNFNILLFPYSLEYMLKLVRPYGRNNRTYLWSTGHGHWLTVSRTEPNELFNLLSTMRISMVLPDPALTHMDHSLAKFWAPNQATNRVRCLFPGGYLKYL